MLSGALLPTTMRAGECTNVIRTGCHFHRPLGDHDMTMIHPPASHLDTTTLHKIKLSKKSEQPCRIISAHALRP